MNKTIVIAGSVVGALAIAAGAAAIVMNQPSTSDPFSSSTVDSLYIVQHGAHGFDLSFDLADTDLAEDPDFSIQISENPDYVADQASDLTFDQEGGHITLPTQQLTAGDHYLWLTTPDGRVPALVTIPDMAPRIWMDGEHPTIEFGEAGDSSWSSYVDPEGKAVYSSAKPVFGADAAPLREGLAITETNFRVENPDTALPYYYLVFTGRDGHSTFVSSPLFATATQGNVDVKLVIQDGAPTYLISGFLASRESAIDRTHQLRVGNFNPSNPGSTFLVDSTYEGGVVGQFLFEVPALELSEGWNDLSIFLTEDGSTLEWSIDATGVDLSQHLVVDQSVFGLRRVEALQLTRLDLLYQSLNVSLVKSGDTALLKVSGSFTDDAMDRGYGLVVKDADGERHEVNDTAASERKFSYSVDLGALSKSEVWYDVEFAQPDSDESVPISTLSVADMRQWVTTGSRTYAFADYDGLLKVFFDKKPFANATVELATVDGVPSLVATGNLVGVAKNDAALRIRTNGVTVQDVANSSTVAGKFRFVFDVRTLSTEGTWYDVVFRQISKDRLTDFSTSSANLSQTLTENFRTYGFQDFEGQLKVDFTSDLGGVDVSSAEIVDVAGTPTLRVEGALDRKPAGDVFLRVRTSVQTIDVPNTATIPGTALFEYDLTGLTEQSIWYDLVIGVTSTGSLTDVASTVADLSQSVTLDERAYSFHVWNDQLKVAFEDASVTISGAYATLADIGGVATLQVTGTVAGTTNGDVFLRIRTGAQTINVPNSAATAGDLEFNFGLSALTQASTWYDLLIGVTSTGTLIDLTDSAADMSQTLYSSPRTYAFHEFAGDLKVAFDVTPVAVTTTQAQLVDVAGVATLQVTGTVFGTTNGDVFLRIRSGAQTIDVPNSAATAGVLEFSYALPGLTQAGTWYDLLVGVTSTSQLTNISDSTADLSQTASGCGRAYSFQQFNHDLKVTFAVVPNALATDAQIVDVSGVPTLRVTGTLSCITNNDAFLRIRSGAQTIDVPNSAVAAGTGLFEYNLSGLAAAGTWYDLLLGVTSTGVLTDVSDSVASMSQTISHAGHAYTFHEYNDLLKVAFDTVPVTVGVVSAELVNASGVATLRVSGTISGTSNGDTFLRIRTGAQTVDVPNTAGTAGTALFEYNLAGLTESGAWYDLLVGVTSSSTLTDVASTVANLSQTVTRNDHTYVFHEWGGGLKVAFGDAAASVAVDTSELLDVSGTPVLRVTGTVEGTTDDDVFLRIRTGAQTVDVANTSTTPGEALFEYNPSNLTVPDTNYELLVGSTSTGTLVAIGDSTANLSQSVALGGRTYGFSATSGKLKVHYAVTPVAVTTTSAQIVNVGGIPTLRVAGTVVGTSTGDAFLRIVSGIQSIDVPNIAISPGAALFEYNLAGLSQAGSWYDLLVGTTSTGTLVDLTPSVANMAQTLDIAGRSYGFREFGGALKVTYSAVPVAVTVSSSQLVDVAGVPTLRVVGTVSGTVSDDAFLRVRSGSFLVNVPNTAVAAGAALFEYDMSGLSLPGVWYDVLVGVTSTGSLVDVLPATANLAQTITVNNQAYSFHVFSGQLKVAFADISKSGAITSAAIVNVSGVPTLQVSGTVSNTTNGDVFLRIRSGATVIDLPNTNATAGSATFTYNLSGLTLPSIWYDMVIGVTSTGSLTDQPSTVANLATSLNIAGRVYAFHEWNGLLKVAYDNRTLGSGESLRIDFGPNDVNDTTRDGNATVSPDVNGKYWNNVSWPLATAAPAANTTNVVPNGTAVTGMRNTTNTATTTAVTINGTNWLTNGINTGGLLAPTVPNLGEFAIATATQDYFFVQNGGTATFTMSGLDPYRLYDLKFFGTRGAADIRKTTYTVVGSNGTLTSPLLQTTGTGTGAGGYNGNNNTLVSVVGAQPTTAGVLTISVSASVLTAGSNFGYLGFMEITGGAALTPPPPPPPTEVQRWVTQDAADPNPANSVLFVGSSSIRRWESLQRDFYDYNIIQRGWGGSWLSGVNDYAPWVVAPYNPSAIVMWAGTNDLSGGKSAAQLLADFRTFVAAEHADSPSTDILYISPTPNPGNAATDAARRQSNALIAAECAGDPKLHFIDIATYFENLQTSDPAAFTALYIDNLHMTPAGYAVWVSMVRPALEAVVAPNKVATPNAATLQPGEKLLFDFGPGDTTNGDATGTDVNGNHWNNWMTTSGGGLVNSGEHIQGLVDTTGRNTQLGMTITAGFLVNGKVTGGLLAPNATALGDLGVATATEDFFYSTADGIKGGTDDDLPGGFMLEGLDPGQFYDFKFFGSRATAETRITQYTVRGANSGSANLQTSGTGIGGGGTYAGNDSQIATVSGIYPDAFGQVFIDLTVVQGSFTHLNAMEVLASPTPPAPMMPMMSFAAPLPEGMEAPDLDGVGLPGDEPTAEPTESPASDEAGEPAATPAPTSEPDPEPTTEPEAAPEPGSGEQLPTGDEPIGGAALLVFLPLGILASRAKRTLKTRRQDGGVS